MIQNFSLKITTCSRSGREISSKLIRYKYCEIIDIPRNSETIDICFSPEDFPCYYCNSTDAAFLTSIESKTYGIKLIFFDELFISTEFALYCQLCDTIKIPNNSVKVAICFNLKGGQCNSCIYN